MSSFRRIFVKRGTRNLLSGWLAIGRPRDGGIVFAAALAVLVPTLWTSAAQVADTKCVEAKLLPSDGAADDSFARDYQLDVSGDVIVVGADGNDDNGDKSGSAYIFRLDGTNWIEETKLLPSDGSAGDHFGRGVAISGDVVVVGAEGNNGNGPQSGSAYIFRFDGTRWIEEAKLLPSDGQGGDRFGRVVAIDGDVIAIGADSASDLGPRSGSAYIFRLDGTNWVEEAKLLASDGAAGDRFGRAVSIDGDVAIFGAEWDDEPGRWSGAAFVFRYDGTNWNEEAKLVPTDGAGGDWFGRQVDIHGALIIVGASRHDDLGYFENGAAYIFRYDGTNWIEETELLASDADNSDWFGRSVTIHGDMAVVGANRTDHKGYHSGSAYIFRYDGTNWVEELNLMPSDGAPWDFFGRGCSLSSDWLVIGANMDDDQGMDSGSAYVFSASVNKEICVSQDRDDGGSSRVLATESRNGLLIYGGIGVMAVTLGVLFYLRSAGSRNRNAGG